MAVVTTAAGRRITYEERGAGPPILLIAGLGTPKGSWALAMERLSPDYRCIAIDNRDAGENDPEDAGYAIADMADDAAGFLRALSIERAAVVGSSMGGFITLHLALNYPLLAERIVLVGTAAWFGGGDLPAPQPEDWIEDPVERAYTRLPSACAPGYFDRYPERLAPLAAEVRDNRMTFEGYLRQWNAIVETHDVRSRLDEILQPALVVHGDEDASVPLAEGEALAAGIPNARLVILPGVGHIPHREMPDRFASLVRDFLAE